ncbi:glutaminyl-peptide cyclotransferase [Scaptodrosophila lebanonensis]|uniref:glutaminyl-peptide cyclotransferase n=1 Tax=Drosophila lebanonensis TaxID=7225 RepID=A0A6J2TCP2_DROLE|nr:glutaminyl-peptide cyclotransferase [Scaptodrosophila lebanonensis]
MVFKLKVLYLALIGIVVWGVADEYFIKLRPVPCTSVQLLGIKMRNVSRLSNITHLLEASSVLSLRRVVGSKNHKLVRSYIVQSLRDLNWHVELDSFTEQTPKLGPIRFHNIIAKLNPNADRYLMLACHYDSKYFKNIKFVGTSDSAVPCAMLLNLALVLKEFLKDLQEASISLMFVFFDGEEAIEEWTATDSLYGSRHLARVWEEQGFLYRIDMLVLLDLIGTSDVHFNHLIEETTNWYKYLMQIENDFSRLGILPPHKAYFSIERVSDPEDDHKPFLERNVPVLHLISTPYPSVWHTQHDDISRTNFDVTEHIGKIIRFFVLQYFKLL